MDIKQELIDKLREAIAEDSSESEITLTVEQIDSLIDTVNDNVAKDGIIKDLQAKLKEKDDIIAKLYTCIINRFICLLFYNDLYTFRSGIYLEK